MLDQEFGETTLRVLRETVPAHATDAGMPEGRALDVMLAVHELAANAVEHGGGPGACA
jgi:anti-sigma regulatory factor (Ser/Thr protein kinase)